MDSRCGFQAKGAGEPIALCNQAVDGAVVVHTAVLTQTEWVEDLVFHRLRERQAGFPLDDKRQQILSGMFLWQALATWLGKRRQSLDLSDERFRSLVSA